MVTYHGVAAPGAEANAEAIAEADAQADAWVDDGVRVRGSRGGVRGGGGVAVATRGSGGSGGGRLKSRVFCFFFKRISMVSCEWR